MPNPSQFKCEKHFFSTAIAVPNQNCRHNKISGRNRDRHTACQSNDETTFAPDKWK
jgi:hypothetical protein